MDTIYSNFDHKLNNEAVEFIKKNEGTELPYYGWEFFSLIRFENNKFKAKIMRYGNIVDQIENYDILNLIHETNDKFGRD